MIFVLRYSKCDNLVRNKMHFQNVVLVRNFFPNALLQFCLHCLLCKSKCSVKSFLKENVHNVFLFDLRFGCCIADMYLMR